MRREDGGSLYCVQYPHLPNARYGLAWIIEVAFVTVSLQDHVEPKLKAYFNIFKGSLFSESLFLSVPPMLKEYSLVHEVLLVFILVCESF